MKLSVTEFDIETAENKNPPPGQWPTGHVVLGLADSHPVHKITIRFQVSLQFYCFPGKNTRQELMIH